MTSRSSYGLVMVLSVLSVLAVSGMATADMSAPRSFYDSGYFLLMFLTISAFNLPINLFWYSLLVAGLLIAVRTLPKKLPMPPLKFAVYLLLTVVLLTAVGALIDLQFLYALDQTGERYVLSFDGVGWMVAAILIFISFYVSSVYIMGLGCFLSLIPSAAIAALNPFFWHWFESSYPHGTGPDDFLLVVTMLSPAALLWVYVACRIKSSSALKKTTSPPEPSNEKQTQST